MSPQRSQQLTQDKQTAGRIIERGYLPMKTFPVRVTKGVAQVFLMGARVHMREGRGYEAKVKSVGAGFYDLWFEEVPE